jgi:effector-binding domain-containing protein
MKPCIIIAAFLLAAFRPLPSYAKKNNIHLITYIMSHDTIRQPVITLEKAILKPMNILFVTDSSKIAELGKAFEKGYGELFAFAGANRLQPGKVMAFYHSYTDPVSVEIAIEVDKIPGRLTGRIQSKILSGGEAVIAHYTGPYEQMEIPYNAIMKWLKDNNKQARGLPFESYLNDPATVKDKYELKTDIYQLIDR